MTGESTSPRSDHYQHQQQYPVLIMNTVILIFVVSVVMAENEEFLVNYDNSSINVTRFIIISRKCSIDSLIFSIFRKLNLSSFLKLIIDTATMHQQEDIRHDIKERRQTHSERRKKK